MCIILFLNIECSKINYKYWYDINFKSKCIHLYKYINVWLVYIIAHSICLFFIKSVEVCNLERYMAYFIIIGLFFMIFSMIDYISICMYIERYFYLFFIVTSFDSNVLFYNFFIMAYMGILNARGLVYIIFHKW